ncbi:MAG: signal peptidase I [Patescibacteria group bacterium]
MKNKLKKLLRIKKPKKVIGNILLAFFGACFLAVVISLLPIPGIYKLYTVSSGSMEPSLKVGSLAVVRPADTYQIEDIVTFRDSQNSKKTTTHRIVSITGQSFETKGDANEEKDLQTVAQSNIVGKVRFTIPYVGYPVGYAKTLPGLIILIVIPSTIIIWEELKKIKKEWGKFQRQKKQEKKQALAAAKNDPASTSPKKKKIAFWIEGIKFTKSFFTFLAVITISTFSINAYFNDQETGAANTMGSGSWNLGCLVINEVYYDVDAEHGLDGEDMNGPQGQGPQNNNPDEWIEIYNNCDYDVSLKNWTITDNEASLIVHANKSVPANGYGLVSKSANTWTLYWGFDGLGNLDGIQIIEIGENGPPIDQILDNAGDKQVLKNPQGTIIDQMNYGNNTDVWDPAVPVVVEGYSLSRDPVGFDTDQPSDFVDNCLPSPGFPTVTINCPPD